MEMTSMNPTTQPSRAALWIAACGVLAFSLPAQAHDQWQYDREYSSQERQQCVRKHLDREAMMLEIKASQQSQWDAYAAARLDLTNFAGAERAESGDSDAAALVRKRADRTMAFAQKLATLADATEKLQAVLNQDQRHVLDRIARFRQNGHRWRDRHGRSGQSRQGAKQLHPGARQAAKPAAKPVPAKAN
jgi:hypothetical protein